MGFYGISEGACQHNGISLYYERHLFTVTTTSIFPIYIGSWGHPLSFFFHYSTRTRDLRTRSIIMIWECEEMNEDIWNYYNKRESLRLQSKRKLQIFFIFYGRFFVSASTLLLTIIISNFLFTNSKYCVSNSKFWVYKLEILSAMSFVTFLVTSQRPKTRNFEFTNSKTRKLEMLNLQTPYFEF